MSDEIISDNFENVNGTKIWLCSEVLTDIFKLLTRRELVQRVQPAGLRFKKICDENVGSIHIIQNANQFIRELINQQNDAIQHYEALKGSKCKLAKQFRLSSFEILICNAETNDATPAKLKRRLLYQQCVMRHCIDLFHGCQVHLYLPGQKLCTTAHAREYFAYLNLLTPVQPAYIEVTSLGHNPSFEMEQLFKEPAILNCPRLTMLQASKNEPGAKAIFDWLHHSQIDEEIGSNSKNVKNEDEEEEKEEKFNNVRCLNIPNTSIANSIEEVMDRCMQNLNQNRSALNRRHFVLSFWSQQSLTEFCIRNDKSGEVLVLENMKIDGVLRTTYYRLRRCLANELDGMEEFYEKMFNGFCKFQIEEEPGKMGPLVEIS